MVYDSEIPRTRPRLKAAPGLLFCLSALLLAGAVSPLAADCPNAVWRPGQSEISLKGAWRF
ncbi:MAG: hypothetical protein RIF32_21195, partial [Leptospirales bacterium]